ncbi:NAD(P)-dependent oxidoreductase [Aciduricibacillus chroicocephali]|uniref:NAD(P)-dependent oxidoreductase n=1 Tax=Aciduricibacillus chroicocephali TaxID=3054939 RepID=A0ABY9KZN8_9BACI|nr:NAD(P)-dependent oxidoreductase [Bacillaceae bacterium 44XB]
MTSQKKPIVGFIGTGVMGKSMAGHIQNAGYPLNVYTRTQEKALDLIAAGAFWKETVAELARESDIIITMIGYPKDVEEVYFGEEGLLNNAKEGSYLVDMTTSKPLLAQKIAEAAAKKGIHAVDAPVSGGDIGAKNATLAIMAGGVPEAFDYLRPIFETMGTNLMLHGPAGSGQHAKMCNQITNASNMMGVCEAIVYAKAAGLNPAQMIETVSSGAANSWALQNLGPRMLKGDYAPGFYVKHFIKDMTIALESAVEMGIQLPSLTLALDLYKQLAEMGEEDSGTQALIKYLER